LFEMTSNINAMAALPEALAGILTNQQDPTFKEPWEAQAFAITVAMHRRGVFSWNEWAETLGEQIRLAQANGDPDLGGTYYLHWLAALEKLVQKKGIADQGTLDLYQEAWHRAAHRTPHGEAIELLPEDLDQR
ncbi:MAG: nitrile hydratase accessory protein, partial [Nitrosomonas sp.]